MMQMKDTKSSERCRSKTIRSGYFFANLRSGTGACPLKQKNDAGDQFIDSSSQSFALRQFQLELRSIGATLAFGRMLSSHCFPAVTR